MFVAPDVQRAGFGRQLLDALEEKARESGLETVELFASLVARPFYERMGFRVVRESCVPLRDGERLDCFIMTKTLRVGECPMQQYVVDFGSTPWASPAPGMRFKAAELGHRKLRLLELSREFVEEDWCSKGHVGYVLEGEIEIDFDGTTLRARAGDGILIPPGAQSKHKATVVSPTARLILVEDA